MSKRNVGWSFGTATVLIALAAAACSSDETGATDGADAGPESPDAARPSVEDAGPGDGDDDDDDVVGDGGDAGDAGDEEPPHPTRCTTTTAPAQGDSFVELCKPAQGIVQHVRISGVQVPATHESAQVVFGFDAPPASATAALAGDQLRVLFYGGGSPAPPALIEATWGPIRQVAGGNVPSLNTAASTVCFDVHDGAADAPPYFAIWVHGQKGANCLDRATLTVASAHAIRASWHGEVGALAKDLKAYYRQSAGVKTSTTVTMSSVAALSDTALKAAVSCSTPWVANTDWQKLCTPAAGDVRHVRIDDASATANSRYFYAVLGQDAAPTGNPAVGAGKLIVTGGRAQGGASWTYFRFGEVAGQSATGQYTYATDTAAPLYTAGPSTVCFDLGTTTTGNTRLVFWATGANGADCSDHATLTTTNALYDSTTDATTGNIWQGLIAAGKENFIKTSGTDVSLGGAVVSSEPAAL
ncbi:MAG: hypothetical protein KF764_30790 [Labilithrix sp.]|nr:hypothetical protein [Labilithrix sp.]